MDWTLFFQIIIFIAIGATAIDVIVEQYMNGKARIARAETGQPPIEKEKE